MTGSLGGHRAAQVSPAVFLDRDGTLIADVGYPRDPAQVRLLSGAAEALARLRAHGFKLVLISNQSGIGRGIVLPEQAEAVHERMREELASRGVALDGSAYCPHAPWEGCSCRKPSPEMIVQAAARLDIDLRRSFMIGDKVSDAEAGRRAGCRTILLGEDAEDWPQVLELILTEVTA